MISGIPEDDIDRLTGPRMLTRSGPEMLVKRRAVEQIRRILTHKIPCGPPTMAGCLEIPHLP